MSYNTDLLDHYLDNTLAQWTADSERRSAFTDLQKANHWVSVLNGLGVTSQFDPELLPSAALDYVGSEFAARGFAEVGTIVADLGQDLDPDTWPAPYAV